MSSIFLHLAGSGELAPTITPVSYNSVARRGACRRAAKSGRYQVLSGPQFTAPGIDIGTTQFGDGFDIGPVTYQ